MIAELGALIFSGLSLAKALRYAAGTKTSVRFQEGRLSMTVFKNKTLEILPPGELAKVQQRYAQLLSQQPMGLPHASESALMTLARELNTRLNLQQHIKSAKLWAEFYEQITKTAQNYDRAVRTYHELFGAYPSEVPSEYRARIERETGRKQASEEFDQEKDVHQRMIQREHWSRESTKKRLEDQASIEASRAQIEENRFKRDEAKLKRERLVIEFQGSRQAEAVPAKPKLKPSRPAQIKEIMRKNGKSRSQIEADPNIPAEMKRRLIEQLHEEAEREIRRLYE